MAVEVPPASDNTTAALPADFAGVVQVTVVAETTTIEAHAVPPIVMVGVDELVNPVPVIVRVVPPANASACGENEAIVGALT